MSNIFVTGYYGTGSSAVIDLLSEFDSVAVALGTRYEHNVFLCHDGLFDLEQRLFGEGSNQMIRDVAINEFIKEMNKQNDNNFGWYGSYKRHFKGEFIKIVNEFVDSISVIGGQDLFSHTIKIKRSPFKAVLQIGAKILKGYKIACLGRVYVHDKGKTRYLTATHEKFIESAKVFTEKYLKLCGKGKINVFDHVVLPEQCNEISKLFVDSKLIIVDRDPRDVYFSAYNVWNKTSNGRQVAPFPLGVEGFLKNWDMMHKNAEKHNDGKNILTVRFEDLVYNYQATVEKIIEFCGDLGEHKESLKHFNPEISIKNTQIFRKSADFKKDCEILEKNLSEYLYDFPFKTDTSINEAKDI